MKTYLKGFSLVELMIGLAILGILVAAGVPSLKDWMQSSQIRTSAESIQNGLQLARTEAVRRNVNVGFYLTTSIGADCALSTAGTSWAVALANPSNGCDVPANAVTGVVQSHSNNEGSPKVAISSPTNAVFFNGLGRQVIPGGGAVNIVTINVTNPTGGACVSAGGAMRCLDITVSTGGNIKMCDPVFSGRVPPDPQGC